MCAPLYEKLNKKCRKRTFDRRRRQPNKGDTSSAEEHKFCSFMAPAHEINKLHVWRADDRSRFQANVI